MAEGNSAILRVGFVLFFLNVVNEVRVSEEKKKKNLCELLSFQNFFLRTSSPSTSFDFAFDCLIVVYKIHK